MQVRPHLELTFENILSHINTIYVLKTKPGVMKVDAPPEYRYLRLKGQMLYVPETDLVIFLCYPSVMNLDDLTRLRIYSKFYIIIIPTDVILLQKLYLHFDIKTHILTILIIKCSRFFNVILF